LYYFLETALRKVQDLEEKGRGKEKGERRGELGEGS